MMRQMTRDEAIRVGTLEIWKRWPIQMQAKIQLEQDLLFMPFGDFHHAIEVALGRPVFTHEFGLNRGGLMVELAGNTVAPTFAEIIEMIPEKKRIIVMIDEVMP